MLRRITIIVIPAIVFIILSTLFVISVRAEDQLTNYSPIQPSNYCVSCHSYGDDRINNATNWVGGIEHNIVSPCPAVIQISEELYYTERLLLAIDRARSLAPKTADLSRSDSRLTAAGQNYSRLLDTPVTSLEAFTAESKSVRFQLGKSYSAVSQAIETAKRSQVVWFALGISIAIVVSLVWGWINAHQALHKHQAAPRRSFGPYLSRGIILIGIFILFSLPIFRLPSQAVAVPTEEEQERQAVVDEARRAALTADIELSRAWILGQIGGILAKQDPIQGAGILNEALTAAQEAQNNNSALWGFSQGAWEAGGAEYSIQGDAALAVSDLSAIRARTWAVRLIAEAWLDIDEIKSKAILQDALTQSNNALYPYDQLDLRAIAVTWAKIDPTMSVEVAERISDPALKSWAFREIAVITGEKSHFQTALISARLVKDPLQRARVLRDLGTSSTNVELFNEAASILSGVDEKARAYALADLAAAAGDPTFATQIPDGYPSAVAFAYFSLGEYEQAWNATSIIPDPFEQARAQAAIAGAWMNEDAAGKINYLLLRDRALRDISIKSGNPELIEAIQVSYYKIQALTETGRYEEAWQVAEELRDGYPLIALGISWAESDPQAAAQIVSALTREADKAEVLREIAVVTAQQDDFENALGMALAARIRGDALSPVKASIDLASIFPPSSVEFEVAISQAYETAKRINIIY